MRVVFLGPPGAGKGTQAARLSSRYGVPWWSTGIMLRSAAASGNDKGNQIASFMRRGVLVPDAVVLDCISENLSFLGAEAGFVLDGFPRSLSQARAFDSLLANKGMTLDAVIEIRVTDDILAGRITGRYSCAGCSEGYHDRFKLPRVAGVCDKCGGTVFDRRSDDELSMVKKRLSVYHAQTEPLVAYYKEKGLLFSVDGALDIDEVTTAIERVLDR